MNKSRVISNTTRFRIYFLILCGVFLFVLLFANFFSLTVKLSNRKVEAAVDTFVEEPSVGLKGKIEKRGSLIKDLSTSVNISKNQIDGVSANCPVRTKSELPTFSETSELKSYIGLEDSALRLYDDEGMDHFAFRALDPRGLADLTEEAQAHIWTVQHPQSCVTSCFAISTFSPGTGLGALVHVATRDLSMSISMGCVFLWGASAAKEFTDVKTCGENGLSILCFFVAPSNCTLRDAEEAYRRGYTVYNSGALNLDGVAETLGLANTAENWMMKRKNDWMGWMPPPVLKKLWKEAHPSWDEKTPCKKGVKMSRCPFGEMKYWWRSQGASYLARFNSNALSIMRKLRKSPGRLVGLRQNVSVFPPFPLPRGSISIHIRHGDKGKEVSLIDTGIFIAAAQGLEEENVLGLERFAFISTEDPEVIEFVSGSNGNREKIDIVPWTYAWFDLPRHNSNGEVQLQMFSNIPRAVLTLSWFLQLLIALEADAWVGTRGSNWNRLLDELRCVWVPKCSGTFVEAGKIEDIEDYQW